MGKEITSGCKARGCSRECCSFSPIWISMEEGKRLSKIKNSNQYQKMKSGWWLTFKTKWCGFFDENEKTCMLGEDRPQACKDFWCDDVVNERIKNETVS